MSSRGDYEPLDPEQQSRGAGGTSRRTLIMIGACTLLLGGVILAVTLPASTNSINAADVGVSGSLVQTRVVVPGASSASTVNGPVTHREFLKTMCNLRKSGAIPWGYWVSITAGDDSNHGRLNSPENLERLGSLDNRPESLDNRGYAWWQNPFIPKSKRLWLEFLDTNNLLRQNHQKISHDEFMQMWKKFLGEKNVATTVDNGDQSPDFNPFIPEFKLLWLEFLESTGLMNATREHIPHDRFVQMWNEFLREQGILLDSPEVPMVANADVTHGKFLKWWFNHLHSGEPDTGSVSIAAVKEANHIPHAQFVAWWKKFLKEQANSGAFDGQQQILEDFLNWWFMEMHNQLVDRKDVVAAFESDKDEDSWKNNPFIPEVKKLWLEFLELNGMNDPRTEPFSQGQLVKMWSDFLEERGVSFDIPGVSGVAETHVFHSQFLQWFFTHLNSGQLASGPVAITSVKQTKGISHDQFIAWWKQFLQDQASPRAFAGQEKTQEDFLNWWFAKMRDRFAMLGTAEAKKEHIPHDQFLDIMCNSLLTGTYDPEFPDADGILQVHQVESVHIDSIDTAVRAAERVLRTVPLIDGHNDLAWQYRLRVQNHIDDIDLQTNASAQWGPSHTDIPRMRKGLMGGQFWSAYTSCSSQYSDAVRVTLDQIDTIKRFVDKYNADCMFVTRSYEIWKAFHRGKIASMIGVEGGHAIDSSMATLRMFYELGVRYLTLTHSCNSPWADAATADSDLEPGLGDHEGLSDWGKKLVREMNRLGMMIDLSHVSYNTMNDVLNTTLAPVMFSHSSAWAICHHKRNVRDDVLRKVALNGGIVMVNFYNNFINCAPNEMPKATLSQVADHIEHIRDVAGIDYVGIGSDFDGSTYVDFPEGLSDVSFYPDLFAELARRNWKDGDMMKLAGLNIIRVFKTVEVVRDRLKDNKLNTPDDSLVLAESIPDNTCRPDF